MRGLQKAVVVCRRDARSRLGKRTGKESADGLGQHQARYRTRSDGFCEVELELEPAAQRLDPRCQIPSAAALLLYSNRGIPLLSPLSGLLWPRKRYAETQRGGQECVNPQCTQSDVVAPMLRTAIGYVQLNAVDGADVWRAQRWMGLLYLNFTIFVL